MTKSAISRKDEWRTNFSAGVRRDMDYPPEKMDGPAGALLARSTPESKVISHGLTQILQIEDEIICVYPRSSGACYQSSNWTNAANESTSPITRDECPLPRVSSTSSMLPTPKRRVSPSLALT